jgi:glycosyltransferase involved in cell wall biosynthesis
MLDQTFSDFEIILVNDGSTDESGQLCDLFSQTDPRILTIHKENGGPGSARNTGLEWAKGSYIGFVDSDDFIDNQMFEVMLNLAEKEQADIIQCGFEFVSNEGITLKTSSYSDRIILGSYESVHEYSLQNDINNYIPCKIFRRDLIDNIRFPEYFASEDACFILKVCFKCNKIVLLSKPFYKYVQHPVSLTRSGINAKSFDSVLAGKMMFDLVNEKFPDLSSYWARYIVLYCVKLFSRSTSHPELNQQRKELTKDFKQYYPILKNSSAMKQISKKSRIGLLLFSIFPEIYASLYSSSH